MRAGGKWYLRGGGVGCHPLLCALLHAMPTIAAARAVQTRPACLPALSTTLLTWQVLPLGPPAHTLSAKPRSASLSVSTVRSVYLRCGNCSAEGGSTSRGRQQGGTASGGGTAAQRPCSTCCTHPRNCRPCPSSTSPQHIGALPCLGLAVPRRPHLCMRRRDVAGRLGAAQQAAARQLGQACSGAGGGPGQYDDANVV